MRLLAAESMAAMHAVAIQIISTITQGKVIDYDRDPMLGESMTPPSL